MRHLIFLAFSIFLMVVQTVVVPEFAGSIGLYDLMVPLAIYFSLYRPLQEGLPIILILGIMMDMLSAAPIGIYLTVYLWLFLGFRQTWRVVRIKQNLLFPAVVAVGVLFENFVFWFLIFLQNGMPAISSIAVKIVGLQLFWAVVSSPLVLAVLHALFRVSDLLGSAKLQENGQP